MTTTQTTAHSNCSPRKPHGRGIYVLLETGPTRRAILYGDPDPVQTPKGSS